jgi:DNA-directed RNA polymerase specialized sigma24 family protein
MVPDIPTDDPYDLAFFLRIAGRAASRILRSPVMVDEAAERAVHRLTLATLAGRRPERPAAWVRVVARRAACALLRTGWSSTQHFEEQNKIADAPVCQSEGLDQFQAQLHEQLSPRQRDALVAALTCNTTRDAARSCGMKPRDFRRNLEVISRKAKRTISAGSQLGPGFTSRPTMSLPA